MNGRPRYHYRLTRDAAPLPHPEPPLRGRRAPSGRPMVPMPRRDG